MRYFARCLAGFVLCCSTYAAGAAADLSAAMSALTRHMAGTAPLTAVQIKAQADIIQSNIKLIGQDNIIIGAAFELFKLYETSEGPLFINAATKGGFARTKTGIDLDKAIFIVQQGLIDYAYTPDNLKKYPVLFDGVKFATSKYFPGAVAPPTDPKAAVTVQVNAAQPAIWGAPVLYHDYPARRPTGCYLAPGSVATVTVPASMVNKGFTIRVGAHSWDLENKPNAERLDRVSIVYPITTAATQIANPLGGGIYIEVPYKAAAGIVNVQIANAVRSPFFSARSFNKTTLTQWLNTERKNPGPWADFESDKFMMQVPTGWIYNFADPVTLMQDWDASMDAVSELFGMPLVRPKTVLYLQIDVVYRGTANFPGYPQSNYPYNPDAAANGNQNHFTLKGPQYSDWTVFHELGHACSFTKFKGETEAAVNLPYVAMQNRKFGVELNPAFGNSGGQKQVTLAQAAIIWMVTENFRAGNPMDISNQPGDEVKYQHRGYGKYVEIARLFGWEALSDFWHSVNVDYIAGIDYPENTDPTDSRILRMSKAAGADLTPLIHFWGVQPANAANLKASIAAAGLQPSRAIYDQLVAYKALIPMNNRQFRDHAAIIYPGGVKEGQSPEYGVGWYYVWLPQYNESHGIAAQAAMQHIIDLYFPNGQPAADMAPPTPAKASFATAPAADGPNAITMTATIGSDISRPIQYKFTETSGNAGATGSAWQTSEVYRDTGLAPGVTYTYTVTMRDALGNTGAPSAPAGAKTDATAALVDLVRQSLIALATPRGVTIRCAGRHTVALYDLRGRVVMRKTGAGPSMYSFHQIGARGIYIVHIITPAQNTRQTLQL
jgi:hypothetical protein